MAYRVTIEAFRYYAIRTCPTRGYGVRYVVKIPKENVYLWETQKLAHKFIIFVPKSGLSLRHFSFVYWQL